MRCCCSLLRASGLRFSAGRSESAPQPHAPLPLLLRRCLCRLLVDLRLQRRLVHHLRRTGARRIRSTGLQSRRGVAPAGHRSRAPAAAREWRSSARPCPRASGHLSAASLCFAPWHVRSQEPDPITALQPDTLVARYRRCASKRGADGARASVTSAKRDNRRLARA